MPQACVQPAAQHGAGGLIARPSPPHLEQQQLAADVIHDQEGGLQGGAHGALHLHPETQRSRRTQGAGPW